MTRNHLRTVLAVSYLRSVHRGKPGFDIDQVVKFLTSTALSGRKAAATAERVHQGMVLVQGRLASEAKRSKEVAFCVAPFEMGSSGGNAAAAVSAPRVGTGSAGLAQGETGGDC